MEKAEFCKKFALHSFSHILVIITMNLNICPHSHSNNFLTGTVKTVDTDFRGDSIFISRLRISHTMSISQKSSSSKRRSTELFHFMKISSPTFRQ